MGSIDSFISRTLAAEHKARIAADETDTTIQENRKVELRQELEKALDDDQPESAIRFAYELHEQEPNNEEIEDLYLFLLDRVGVPVKQPKLGFCASPLVIGVSGVYFLTTLIYFVISLFTVGPESSFDPWMTLLLLIASSVPFFDGGYAHYFNHQNKHRLKH